MIILGLGSNIGNRLQHLRDAVRAIKQITGVSVEQVSPVYMSDAQLPDNAPGDWDQAFLNCAVRCSTSLAPSELLNALKHIEVQIGRSPEHEKWSPRVLDIDILAWDDQIITADTLAIPHPRLCDRPFALWPLADLIPLWQHPQQQLSAEQLVEKWGSRFSGEAPFHTRQINQRIDTPALVGIINVTPDSFSDGGKFTSAELALQQAIHLVEAGAEILDIGAESTAPSSPRISTQTEWDRLQPALAAILAARKHFPIPVIISVDTMHAETATKAIAQGVDWINDVSGLTDPAMRATVRDSTVDCIVMHHLTIPPVRGATIPRDQDPVNFLYNWGQQHIAFLENEGIARNRIIIDPGIGFGKSTGQALAIINRADKFSELGVRVLIGHSRKLFMANLSPFPAPERDLETLVMTVRLAEQTVNYIRVHNVEMSARALRINSLLIS